MSKRFDEQFTTETKLQVDRLETFGIFFIKSDRPTQCVLNMHIVQKGRKWSRAGTEKKFT